MPGRNRLSKAAGFWEVATGLIEKTCAFEPLIGFVHFDGPGRPDPMKSKDASVFQMILYPLLMALRAQIPGKYPVRCARQAATVPNLRLEVREKLNQHDENLIRNGVENGSNP